MKTPLSLLALFLLPVASSSAAIIAQQDFESTPATPTVGYTTTGTWVLNSGAVTGTFSPSGSTWAAAGQGIGADSNTATILLNDIDTTGFSSISLDLRIAALSGTTSDANGMELGDTFTVEVSPDGGSNWYSQIVVTGSSSNNARWSYSGGSGVATVGYTIGGASTFTPGGGGIRTTDGYSFISVTSLPSTSALKIRLTAIDNSANERWLVDSIAVSGTAVPEPSGAAILGSIGMLGLLRRRR